MRSQEIGCFRNVGVAERGLSSFHTLSCLTGYVGNAGAENIILTAIPVMKTFPFEVQKMFRKESGQLVLNSVIGRRLLNVREAAQYLGLEVDTVYKKARLREVPCVKVGRALRFDVKALERFIDEHTIETIE